MYLARRNPSGLVFTTTLEKPVRSREVLVRFCAQGIVRLQTVLHEYGRFPGWDACLPACAGSEGVAIIAS